METDRAPEEVALHQGGVGHVRGGEAPEAEGQVGCNAKSRGNVNKEIQNTQEQNVNQSLDENKYKEVKAAVVDAHDVKEEVDDELPSPCPSPGQSPKRISDENEFELKEEVEESFF